MTISFQIPQEIEAELRKACGDVVQLAKESLAVEVYTREMLSIGQVAEVLGTSVYEAEGLMKARGVASRLTMLDIDHDRNTIRRVLEQ